MSQRRSRAARSRAPEQPITRRWISQRTLVIGVVLVWALALIVFVVRSVDRSANVPIDRAGTTDATLIAQGQQIYRTRCAGCHGLDRGGEAGWPQRRANGTLPAPPLDASGTAWQRRDDWLFTTIKNGGQATASPGTISTMPAFGGSLTDDEIRAVLLYLSSTWPDRTAAPPATP